MHTPEIWTDYVWTEDETEAYRKCQAKAEEATANGGTPVKLVAIMNCIHQNT
ncbi:MAG: hypothetical protein KME46_10790 [Brasilonema angustatum HA4187-MV1]|jgi:hypothetical protein|nr:hypothetical protein [Brasilonema angustatum HA4187-MV1]